MNPSDSANTGFFMSVCGCGCVCRCLSVSLSLYLSLLFCFLSFPLFPLYFLSNLLSDTIYCPTPVTPVTPLPVRPCRRDERQIDVWTDMSQIDQHTLGKHIKSPTNHLLWCCVIWVRAYSCLLSRNRRWDTGVFSSPTRPCPRRDGSSSHAFSRRDSTSPWTNMTGRCSATLASRVVAVVVVVAAAAVVAASVDD